MFQQDQKMAKFERNNDTSALNVLYVKHNTKK